MSCFDLYFSSEKLNWNRKTGRALQDSARRFYFPEFLTSYKKNKKWREKFHVLLSISRTGKKAMLQNMIKSVCPGEIRLQSPAALAYRLPLAHSVTPILFTSLSFLCTFGCLFLPSDWSWVLLRSSCLPAFGWFLTSRFMQMFGCHSKLFIQEFLFLPQLLSQISLAPSFIWDSVWLSLIPPHLFGTAKILGVQLNLDVP